MKILIFVLLKIFEIGILFGLGWVFNKLGFYFWTDKLTLNQTIVLAIICVIATVVFCWGLFRDWIRDNHKWSEKIYLWMRSKI